MKSKRLYFILFLCLVAGAAISQVRLPKIISHGMVLQRDAKLRVWGWASPGEKISIVLSSDKKKVYRAKANKQGEWEIQLASQKAGGPYNMKITANNELTIDDILFGDVWFCSGQSNMVHQMNIHDVLYAKEIAEANNPEIRQFWIPTLTNLQGKQNDIPSGNWQAAVGEKVRPFSAVAYFFALKLYQKYKIPIGIINSSVGGTPIEAWTSEEGLKEFPEITSTLQKNKDTGYVNSTNRSAQQAPWQSQDLGMSSPRKWYELDYTPKGWRTINIPGYWEDQGIKDLNGVVWYRKEIDIPASMAGKPARVFLGRIVDADVLYINGKQVGATTYQYPQRRYSIPADLLKQGKNLFVVRVTNNNGKGGFVPDKPYYLFSGKDTIDLKGYWEYKVGEVFTPRQWTGSSIVAQNQPSALYNAMVAPVINYSVKGFLWYQGEANTSRAKEYAKLQAAMITDWRNKWNQPNAPFLYAQLPGFMDYNYLPSESNWAALREAQLQTLNVPNTAMTVTIDLGEWNDIHPDNKKDVGERLALLALRLGYGEQIVHSGPLYHSSKVSGNRIAINFTHIGSGLISRDGEELHEFAIAGPDKKFVWAKAKIEGDQVIVWNENVPVPVYVRYAWSDNPVQPNLFNKEGLPASPFRTDNP
jgi:sialate O-acetylesterase